MKINAIRVVALSFALVASGLGSAGPLETWSGTLERKGHPTEEVVFLVEIVDRKPRIETMVYADEPFKIKRLRIEGERLYFSWTPGKNDAECELKLREQGDYRGDCQVGDSENLIKLRIQPVAEPGSASAESGERAENEADKKQDDDQGDKSGEPAENKASKKEDDDQGDKPGNKSTSKAGENEEEN